MRTIKKLLGCFPVERSPCAGLPSPDCGPTGIRKNRPHKSLSAFARPVIFLPIILQIFL